MSDLVQARATLLDPNAGFWAHLSAVEVLTASADASLWDLVDSIRCHEFIAELAAAELYRRTKTELPKDVKDYRSDYEYWARVVASRLGERSI